MQRRSVSLTEQIEMRHLWGGCFRRIVLDDDIRIAVTDHDIRCIAAMDDASDRNGGNFEFSLLALLLGNFPCVAPLPFRKLRLVGACLVDACLLRIGLFGIRLVCCGRDRFLRGASRLRSLYIGR